MKTPELVLPAGDFERSKIAFLYGADAVYLGLPEYSMRKTEVRFKLAEIKKTIQMAHEMDKKVFVTFNIFAHNNLLSDLSKDLKEMSRYQPDAFIVSDLGILNIIKQQAPQVPIHLSTQQNVTNWESVKFWRSLGIKRIVLARELTLTEIKEIKTKVKDIELEIFVHGAMCVSYSGRCLLSAYLTGREANQGECAQPCRWEYRLLSQEDKGRQFYLEEKQRPKEYLPIEEHNHGTTIMSSKDLRLVRYLPEIVDAKIDALKIEGRNKTAYYVAETAYCYRQALQLVQEEKYTEKRKNELEAELEKLNFRDYTTGFLFNDAKNGAISNKREPIRNWNFAGLTLDESGTVLIKNQLNKGQEVEILTPKKIHVDRIEKIEISGQEITKVDPGKKDQTAKISFSQSYPRDSFIRNKPID